MHTLLVKGRDDVPPELREIVRRGSETVDEIRAADLSTHVSRESFGVDRIVFWAGASGHDIRSLALAYATAAGVERPQRVVFVTAAPSETPLDGMSREEIFVWPRDEDKLKMAFMTGA